MLSGHQALQTPVSEQLGRSLRYNVSDAENHLGSNIWSHWQLGSNDFTRSDIVVTMEVVFDRCPITVMSHWLSGSGCEVWICPRSIVDRSIDIALDVVD